MIKDAYLLISFLFKWVFLPAGLSLFVTIFAYVVYVIITGEPIIIGKWSNG